MNLHNHATHHAKCGCTEAMERIMTTLDRLTLQGVQSNYEKAQAILEALGRP